jgi:cation/acetate symporter
VGVTGWTWLLVALTFAGSMAVALWARVRTTSAYYVADRQVSPVVNGVATAAEWMSAATFISMAGVVSSLGRDGSTYLMGWTGGYVLLAVLVAPYLRRYGKYTVPQFVGDRYDSRSARFVALLCALLVSLTYLSAQLRGVGVVLARLLDVSLPTGILVAMAAVFVYAAAGGMKSLTYTQVAQYVVLIVAYLVPAVLFSRLLTGHAVPQIGLGAALTDGGARLLGAEAGRPLLEVLDGLSSELGFGRYTAGARSRADVLLTTAALMVGTAGLPHILIRFFTVPKVRDARASAAWALVFIAVLYTAAPAVAAFGRATLIATLSDRPHADAPEWFRTWERTGLARFADRDGDGRMRLAADPARNEVQVDPDILVLALPEMAGLAPWVVALLAAGALAAAMSSAAALVLVLAATVSHDLMKGILVPRLPERLELHSARAAAALAVAVAGVCALHSDAPVARVVASAFGLAASTFFPAIVLGIFWTRGTKEGAIAGMAAGVLLTGGYLAFFELLRPDLNGPAHWWLGISPQGIGAVGMVLNLAIAVAVSLRTPAPPQRIHDLVVGLRSPREPRRRALP